MSRAPSVSHPVSRGRASTIIIASLWLAAVAANLAWISAVGPADIGPAWGISSLALATAVLLTYLRRMPTGQLSWDGEQWRWTSRAYPVGVELDRPQIVIDLQWLVIVRTRNRAGASWTLWLEARCNRPTWHGLRLALYASPALDTRTLGPHGPGA